MKLSVLRARRRQRGAVFVEAIIVSSLLILLLISGLFLHRAYAHKITNTQQARALAWSQALGGCGGNLDIVGLFQGMVRIGSPTGLAALALSGQIGQVERTTGSAESEVRAPAQLGGRRYHLSGSTQLACNEQTQGERGDLFDIALYAAQNFLSTVF